MLEVHADFLESVFVELVDRGQLRDEWIERHVRELDRPAGDVEELVARIASVRTWTYVSNRTTWLAGATDWEARTRGLEDRLSDALHERLVARFVDAKKKHAAPARRRARVHARGSRARTRRSSQLAGCRSHPFAKLVALRSSVAVGAFDGRRRLGRRIGFEPVLAAEHAARLTLTRRRRARSCMMHAHLGTHRICAAARSRSRPCTWRISTSAQARRAGCNGRSRSPSPAGRRRRADGRDRRLWRRRSAPAPLRGLVHRLEQGLRDGPRGGAGLDVLNVLDAESRAALSGAAGVVFARRGVVYVAGGLAPARRSWSTRGADGDVVRRRPSSSSPPSGGPRCPFAPSRGVDRTGPTPRSATQSSVHARSAPTCSRAIARGGIADENPTPPRGSICASRADAPASVLAAAGRPPRGLVARAG